jgi:hypothetical protein
MHTPICPVCNENEVGSLRGGTEYYCSSICEASANAEELAIRISPYDYDAAGDGWGYDDIQAMYDDDPNPYAGTYSEE